MKHFLPNKEGYNVNELIVGVCVIVCIVSILWSLQIYANYIKAQKRLDEFRIRSQTLEMKIQEIEESRKEKSIEYSNNIMKYIREFIAQIATLQFKTFVDGHNMNKITEANIKKLVQDIAEEVKTALNEVNILFDNMLFTKDFYDKYIVETTVITVKTMLEKFQLEH